MPQLNVLAIIVAAVASFAASAIWYMRLGRRRDAVRPGAGAPTWSWCAATRPSWPG